MYRYLLAYGSNVGDKHAHLKYASSAMDQIRTSLRQSQWIETPPLERPSHYPPSEVHENYLNFVEDCSSMLEPVELYRFIADIEDERGHNRDIPWAPRQLDIDIVLWAKNDHDLLKDCTQLSQTEPLMIPHPGWKHRDFWTQLSSQIGAYFE